jgi:membrane associated rhomboid family serine protease
MPAPLRGSSSSSGTPPWLRPVTERLSPTITALVIVTAVMFAFYAVVQPARDFVDTHLALNRNALAVPEPWQVVTSLFVHLDGISLIFDLIGIWFVGATMERDLGRRRFLILFFVPAIVGNLVMAGGMWLNLGRTGGIAAGCSLAVLGLFVAFGKIYGRTPARVFGSLVLEARTLTLILIGFALLADLMRFNLVAFAADVVVLAVAFGLTGRRGTGFDGLIPGLPRSKPRRRFEVVEGGQKPDRPGRAKEGRGAGYLN